MKMYNCQEALHEATEQLAKYHEAPWMLSRLEHSLRLGFIGFRARAFLNSEVFQ